jgi:hypothetical protein
MRRLFCFSDFDFLPVAGQPEEQQRRQRADFHGPFRFESVIVKMLFYFTDFIRRLSQAIPSAQEAMK